MKNPCEAASQASPNAPTHVGPQRCFRKILANREMGGKFCSSERTNKFGCFQKWWYPQNHPFVHRVFHYFHHPFWGKNPYFWKHPNPQFPKIFVHHSTLMAVDEVWKLLFFLQGAMYAKRKSLCHQSLSKKHAASDSARTISTNHEPVEKNCQEIPCLPVLPPMLLGCLRPASIDNSVDFPDPFFPTMPTLNKTAHPQAIRNLTDLSCGWWKQSLRNLKSAQQRIFLENSEIFVKNGCSLCSHSLRAPRHSAWHAEFYRDLLEDGLLGTCCHAKVGFSRNLGIPLNRSAVWRALRYPLQHLFLAPFKALRVIICRNSSLHLPRCAQCQANSLLGLHLCTGKQLCSKSPLLPPQKTPHWRFYISFLDSYWRLREGLTLCSGVANFLLANRARARKWQIQTPAFPVKLWARNLYVASVNKNWYFETNEGDTFLILSNLPRRQKKKLSGIGKAIRFPSSGPKPKPHDR